MTTFEQQVIQLGEKQKLQELEKIVREAKTQEITAALVRRVGSESMTFWNYVLQGFDDRPESKEKRFACVKALFEQMGRVELSYKQTYDLISRLFQDLPSFPSSQLVEIVEYSMDGLRSGDPKNVGWKDLLPETVALLASQGVVLINGVQMSGADYRSMIVKNLISMKWPTEVLTPVANMFCELKLNPEEITIILKKFSNCILKMAPSELPALAYQLFSMCTSAAHVIIPIVGFQEYYHKFYYKKLFEDMDSNSTDFDNIERFSDKELREAEETILHHLSYCTQFKISEGQMCVALRGLSSTPHIILSPFFLSAVLSMTQANREPDARLSSSVILPFLRNVIRSNEEEKELSKVSAWCRNTLPYKQTDLEQTFSVLIDQNKEGKDVVTPGLVSLAFVLLKTKNAPALHQLAISFLRKFIKKRFIFGKGVVQNIVEWMVVDQEAMQYSECLTILSIADTFTVSECTRSINYVLDYLLWIPGEQGMRMMSFILPVLKISHPVRDAFIDTLTKAMHSRDPEICRLGVHGLCMILRQLTNNNAQRSATSAAGSFTQHNISGLSLMSQATLGNRANPQRHFDMLTLEIIGLLRNCFSQTLQIRMTLYEGIAQAVDSNPKLVPHILQFLEAHFRSHFDDTTLKVEFDGAVKRLDTDNDVEVRDNLGVLVRTVCYCLTLCDKLELNYQTSVIRDLLLNIIIKLCEKSIIFDAGIKLGAMTHYKNELVLQHLNVLESLMSFLLWTSTPQNSNIEKLFKLFQLHKEISEEYKAALQPKKGAKKSKQVADAEPQTATKKPLSKPENCWNLGTVARFLTLLHEENVPFAKPEAAAPLRTDRHLVRYVLQTAAYHVERLRQQPAYKQVSHSRRTFAKFTELTRVVYERCVKRLQNLWANFDVPTAFLAAQCFLQCLTTARTVYAKKYDTFGKDVGFAPTSIADDRHLATLLQSTVEQCVEDEDELCNEPEGKKICLTLLQCLELHLDSLSHDEKAAIDGCIWLNSFCQSTELKTKEMGVIHKILFDLREKTHAGGSYLSTIAMHLEKTYGQIDGDQAKTQPEFELKSVQEATAEACCGYLCNRLRKQLEDVEYFVTKANSLHYKLKLTFEEDQEEATQSLKTMERAICSQLQQISTVLLHLSNVCLPLGACMDNQVRVLIQLYICLTNCVKHFILRNSTIPVSLQGTKFDHVLKVTGKPLGTRIYALITYIEANIFQGSPKNRKSAVNPTLAKAKVIRETKLLPKLILRVENFNKFIILLSNKTDTKLNNFLHIGTVRDFRIRTEELKTAIDDTLTHCSQIEVSDSLMDRNDDEDEEDPQGEEVAPPKKRSRIVVLEEEDESTPERDTEVLEHESNNESHTQVLKNMAKLNKEAKKRKRSVEEQPAEEPAPKKKGKRVSDADAGEGGSGVVKKKKADGKAGEKKKSRPRRSTRGAK